MGEIGEEDCSWDIFTHLRRCEFWAGVEPWSTCTDLQRGLCLSRGHLLRVSSASAGAQAPPPMCPRALIPCVPDPSLSWALSCCNFHRSKCWDFTSSVQTCGSTSSHCCPSCWWCLSRQMLLGSRAAASSDDPAGAALLSRCQAVSSRSFPGVQRADGHHMHVYFCELLPLCTQYSEQYLPNSASRHCLVPLCSEESLLPPAEPALLCVALVPASEITSPVFLVSDWRQNRDN